MQKRTAIRKQNKQEMSLKKDKRRQIKKGRKYNTRLSTCT